MDKILIKQNIIIPVIIVLLLSIIIFMMDIHLFFKLLLVFILVNKVIYSSFYLVIDNNHLVKIFFFKKKGIEYKITDLYRIEVLYNNKGNFLKFHFFDENKIVYPVRGVKIINRVKSFAVAKNIQILENM